MVKFVRNFIYDLLEFGFNVVCIMIDLVVIVLGLELEKLLCQVICEIEGLICGDFVEFVLVNKMLVIKVCIELLKNNKCEVEKLLKENL